MASKVKNSGSAALHRAAEKRCDVLKHFYRWGISDVHCVAELLDLGASGARATVAKMILDGIIGSAHFGGCRVQVLHLTPVGLTLAEQLLADDQDAFMPTIVYPSRIRAATVIHDLLSQRWSLELLKKNPGYILLSARQVEHRRLEIGRSTPLAKRKVPDSILITPKGNRAAVELQQTAEPSKTVERVMSQYGEAIERGEIRTLIYGSTSPAILNRIQRISAGRINRWWFNSDHKKWYESDASEGNPVTADTLQNRFKFSNLERFASTYYSLWVR